MAYNHGREDRKWRIWKEAEEKLLRECGVDEATIEQIRIVVHERDRKGSIQTTQRVDIYFSFIGTFVPPAEPIDPEVAAAMEAERQAIEAKKDRLHQNYLKRKANGSQQKYEARYESRRIARMKELKEALPKNSMSVAEYYAMRKETRYNEPIN